MLTRLGMRSLEKGEKNGITRYVVMNLKRIICKEETDIEQSLRTTACHKALCVGKFQPPESYLTY